MEQRLIQTQLVTVENVTFSYLTKRNCLSHTTEDYTLYDLSFQLSRYSSTAIVGESGSGKTTVAKLLLGLLNQTSGKIMVDNQPLYDWLKDSSNTLSYRKKVQLIFQDPDASLNPKRTLGGHLDEALSIHFPNLSKKIKKERIEAVLSEVALPIDIQNRFSFELSGGQKQRLIIARALLIEPELLILDEPLSSLDASIRKSIISLLENLYITRKMTYLYVTHDLSTVPRIASHVIIMYRGVIVEEGKSREVFQNPIHPYTQLLIESVPTPNPQQEKNKKRIFLPEKSKPLQHSLGCTFAHRCPFATELCRTTPPILETTQKMSSHKVRCHYPDVVKKTIFSPY